MSEKHPYTVKVKAETRDAVLVQVLSLRIEVWLPRSKVTLPEGIERGAVIEVNIPRWIIKNEIGEPI